MGNEEFSNIIAGLIWCLYVAKVENNKVNLAGINAEKLSTYDCALLAQGINSEKISPTTEKINKKALIFAELNEDQRIENKKLICGKDILIEISKILKENKELHKEYDFKQKEIVANCYIAPMVSVKKKVCIIFEYMNDMLLGANTGTIF